MQKSLLPVIAGLTALFLGCVIAHFSDMLVHGRQYDDAYITYRYAVNLAEGRGFVFNTYERVNSASSFLYTVLLAGFHALGFQDLERVAALLGLASGCGLIAFTAAAVLRITAHPVFTALLMVPLFLSGALAGWAVSGMETVFFSMLIMAFLWAYLTDRFAVSLLLLAACLLTRFEAVLLLLSLLAAEWSAGGYRLKNRRLAACAAAGALAFGGLMFFYAAYYGSAVPHPVLLKKYAVYYSLPLPVALEEALTYLIKNFALYTLLAIGFSLVVVAREGQSIRRRLARGPDAGVGTDGQRACRSTAAAGMGERDRRGSLLIAVYTLLSLLSFVLGPTSDQNRYMTHLLPVMAVATARVCRTVPERLSAPRAAVILLGVILLVAASYQAARNQVRVAQFFSRTADHQMAREQIGRWLQAQVPSGQLILSSDVGAIAYFAKSHDFIDTFGLTSRSPVAALEKGQWSLFIEEMKAKKPSWAADTGAPDGTLQALEILNRPSRFYRGVPERQEPYLHLYGAANREMLSIPARDGRVFRVIQIDPRSWL